MSEAEPVSWFMIERGWRVETADGKAVGTVEEVAGDSSLDIFNGLTVATGLLHPARYVPAELVVEILDGRVRLSVGQAEVGHLGEHHEPPPSEQIRPE
jgi:hypothetical protein